jgi:NTE family protein
MATRRRGKLPADPPVNLALQGGGSHGAFTWGVLDALLEDGRLSFEGVSGASAGAMNAVVMAEGWRLGLAAGDARAGARAQLRRYWEAVGDLPNAFAFPFLPSSVLPGAVSWWQLWSGLISPYQLNPFNYNPLRDLLQPLVNFGALRAAPPFKLFVCATNVRSGRARVFRDYELTLDMLLASAALPTSFRAVEIDGEAYWDGGYMGNPALYPLFYATATPDLLLVQINPLRREDVPDEPQEILDRVSEISFNASLLQELRAIAFVQRLLDENRVEARRYKRIRLHRVDGGAQLAAYGAASKANTSARFIGELFALGRGAAQSWLETSFDYVGHAPSVVIGEAFL